MTTEWTKFKGHGKVPEILKRNPVLDSAAIVRALKDSGYQAKPRGRDDSRFSRTTENATRTPGPRNGLLISLSERRDTYRNRKRQRDSLAALVTVVAFITLAVLVMR